MKKIKLRYKIFYSMLAFWYSFKEKVIHLSIILIILILVTIWLTILWIFYLPIALVVILVNNKTALNLLNELVDLIPTYSKSTGKFGS